MKRLRLSLFVLCVISLVFSEVVFAQVDYERLTMLDWSADSAYIALGHTSGKVKIFEAQTRELSLEFQAHEKSLVDLEWSPISRNLLTLGYRDSVKVWVFENNNVLLNSLAIQESALSVTWKPDGEEVAIGYFEVYINIWSPETGSLLTLSDGGSNSMRWSSDSKWFATKQTRFINVYDSANFELLSQVNYTPAPEIWTLSIEWSPQNHYLVVSDGYGRVFVWEVGNQKLVHTFNSAAVEDITVGDASTHAALKARFSADGRSVQAINADGTIRSWDLATGRLLSEVKVASPIVSAAWSPYGAQLVVDLLNPPQGDAQDALAANNLQILVPFASLDQFKAIASVCITSTAEQAALQAKAASESLAGLSAYVSSLPVEVIPPACAADLLAIAEALQ